LWLSWAKISNTIRCGLFVIVLSQDFQQSLGSGQSQKDHSEWCWKSWLRAIAKTPQRMVLEVLA
jgi:hypothetical protein